MKQILQKKPKKNQKKTVDWSILEASLPLYTTAQISKIIACHKAVLNKEVSNNTVKNKSEKWVLEVVKDSMQVIELGDKWFNMSDKDFMRIRFEGLNDFSLITLSSMAADRALDSTNLSNELNNLSNEIMSIALKPGQGSILVDYGWMYQDTISYNLIGSGLDIIATQHKAVAHDITYNNAENTISLLGYLAWDTLRMGDFEKGAWMLAELIDNNPDNFGLAETSVKAFFEAGYKNEAQLMLSKVARIARDHIEYRSRAEDLVFAADLTSKKSNQPQQPLPSKLVSKLEQISKKTNGTLHKSAHELAASMLPQFDQIPIKKIPLTI